MRILIRTSKWAIWARRFGSFALPLAAIPVFLHREHTISSENFAIIEIVAMAIAALAVVLAFGAFVRLWITGDQGWWKATLGLFFGLLCLAPAVWLATLAFRYPMVTDVPTDFSNPPQLVTFVPSHFIGPEERQRIETAFPNARSRTYPVDAAQMFDVVSDLVDAQGWDPRARRVPQSALDGGQLNAVATTLFGWRDEVVVRITGSGDGSTVAMRSTSLTTGIHDFGENGKRVEQFMLALDTAITELLRDAPTTGDS